MDAAMSLLNSTEPLISRGLVSSTVASIVRELCSMTTIVIVLLGMLANSINAAVFCKQGFESSVNIGLFCLAVADLGTLVSSLVWIIISGFVANMSYAGIKFAGAFMSYFLILENWITLIITAEQCICVALPLKAKQIITRQRTTFGIIFFCITILLLHVPQMATIKFGWYYDPVRNVTLFGASFTSMSLLAESIILTSVAFIRPLCIVLVLVFTLIKVYHLKSRAAWRKNTLSPSGTHDRYQGASSKEMQISKMVLLVATILIVCTLPWVVSNVVIMLVPEFHWTGQYRNLLMMYASVIMLLETINVSINIFVYYSVSAKYRNTLHNLFSS